MSNNTTPVTVAIGDAIAVIHSTLRELGLARQHLFEAGLQLRAGDIRAAELSIDLAKANCDLNRFDDIWVELRIVRNLIDNEQEAGA